MEDMISLLCKLGVIDDKAFERIMPWGLYGMYTQAIWGGNK